MSTLHEQQRAFAKFIMAGDVAKTDAERSAVSLSGEPGLALKRCTANSFTDSQRLQIYRNNTAISLRAALAAVYPVIQRLVGEDFFQHLAREYVHAYPSYTGNLHDFGAALANHLHNFPGTETLPYLSDVAQLEWAYHRVFHAAESPLLNLNELAILSESQIAALTFQISTSCCLLASDYPILRIWQANQSGANSPTISLDEGGVHLAVLRHAQQVEFYQLGAGVFALVDALGKNQNFAQACEAALSVESDCDIGTALQLLLSQRMVSGYHHPAEEPTDRSPASGEDNERSNGQCAGE